MSRTLHQKTARLIVSSLLSIVVIIMGGTLSACSSSNPNSPTATAPPSLHMLTPPSGNLRIGLSDGSYAFDTDRPDGEIKNQAAMKFRQRDIDGAKALWQQALNVANESNDAEALIYLEDQRVMASGGHYITLVVGTILTGGKGGIGTGRDNLQGAYVAQKEFNDGFKMHGGLLIRLLIANASDQSANAATVAQQIVQQAKVDSTIVGVMGWPYSGHSLKAIPVLAKAQIPLVSQAASSDGLTAISPFFFRVVPSNKSQAIAGANYAESQLHSTNVAIFLDPNNTYSANLADDFGKKFTTDGNHIVATEHYTIGAVQNMTTLLQDAINHKPDLIYFAGYVDDLAVLLTDLGTSNPDVNVLGGDALYQLNGYPPSARPAFDRLHFTAFAHPNEWDVQGSRVQSMKPTFFTLYASNFDPKHVYPFNQNYGYTRPTADAMLSYDATLVLLEGVNNALSRKNSNITPVLLQGGLQALTGAQAIQGVTGQISLGGDDDPMNKAVVILFVDQNNFIQIYGVEGCFLAPSVAGGACS
jgi:eukaryotic-like serine/threonine-protein kinase